MDDRFRLAHLSDLHVALHAPPAPRALLNKRLLGVVSWWAHRRHAFRPEILDALVDDLKRVDPDHVAITGDLTTLGLPVEFEAAARQLRSVGPPERVSVVPGNHDAYVPVPWASSWELWTDYMTTEAEGATPRPPSGFDDFPWVRRRGSIALVGLSSAVPTGPFVAQGRLGPAQLDRLEDALRGLGRAGLFRVVLVHHSPVEGTIRDRKGLTDAADLRAVVRRAGAELILHGHEHRARIESIPGADEPVRVIGVPSASAAPRLGDRQRGAQYHLLEIETAADGWRVALVPRRYDAGTAAFLRAVERRFEIRRPGRLPTDQDSVVPTARPA